MSRNRSPIHLECEIIPIGKADIGQIVEKVDGPAAVVLKCDAVVRIVIPRVAREDADEVPDPENLGVVRPSGVDDRVRVDGAERPMWLRQNPLLDMRQMVRGIRRVVGAGPSGADDVRDGATLAGGRLEDAVGRFPV